MKDTIKLGVTLLIVCAVAAVVLAFSNNATKGLIEEQERLESEKLLIEIFGEGNEFSKVSDELFQSIKAAQSKVIDIYEVKTNGQIQGYAVKDKSNGYKPDVVMLVGITNDGKVKGLRVVSHAETKGIGTNALTAEYMSGFNEKSVEEPIEVDVVSGASRTSNALIRGVNIAREVYLMLTK